MTKIQRLLIANRGEIAVRIARSAKKRGIETTAIYSDADRHALHVKVADHAIRIGPPPSRDSYLRGDLIIQEALAHQCDAIHPGYGFLSEDPSFARDVKENGLLFVGPDESSISLMGDKLAAKKLAERLDIPLVPGSDGPIIHPEEAISFAEEIGFPVMLKAAGGGGGKGMRIVYKAEDFVSAFERSSSEALQSFGNAAVFIEKYIESPKHIEVQILADHQGSVLHLFERDCSVQRRHQKVIEEAPAPIMNPPLRSKLTNAAIKLAKASNYVNAGTVEFLVDGDDFYFLEMNTRLQVEHPVTEMITGLDLVQLQLSVAEGLPLPVEQEDLQIRGHSIELRVYAEDATSDFVPSIGRIEQYNEPDLMNVRIDSGFRQEDEISIYYDPMIAKLIVYGASRMLAIEKLVEAIQRFEIKGVETTLAFGAGVCRNEVFRKGTHTTRFIQDEFDASAIPTEHVRIIEEISEQVFRKKNQQLKVADTSIDWYKKQ